MPFELVENGLTDPAAHRNTGGLCRIGDAIVEVLARYEFADLAEPGRDDVLDADFELAKYDGACV
jgi:hypothetical protein